MAQYSKKEVILSTIFLVVSPSTAFAWGARGHELTITLSKIQETSLANCKITKDVLLAHVNDPDTVWKNQRFKFKNESHAHYFHVDEQPSDWKKRNTAANNASGFLVYRIADWVKDAKEAREKKNFEKLKERIIGLCHYLGDLTQPLHLNSDHDGLKSGLEGIHSQFETKMVAAYYDQIRSSSVRLRDSRDQKKLWSTTTLDELKNTVAEQSNSKASELLNKARAAYEMPHTKNSKKSKKSKYFSKPHWIKKKLWAGTGEMAVQQITLASELITFYIDSICK